MARRWRDRRSEVWACIKYQRISMTRMGWDGGVALQALVILRGIAWQRGTFCFG